MTTYVKTTDFEVKDSLLTGDQNKVIRGTEIDNEFDAIQVADADNVKTSGLGAGVATFLATPSSANLAAAVTGETGSGALVFGTAPTLTNAVVTATSGDALRVTNTGTGNSLVVEDSANPDSTPFVIDANGIVVSGNTSSISLVGASYNFQSHASNHFAGVRWNAAATGPTWLIGKSRSATVGTNSIVLSGDVLGNFNWVGDDGSSFIIAAQIKAEVDGTPGTNDMPGRLVFSTTADGASTPTERMRIASDGLVSIQSNGGLSIARTAVTAPAASDGNIFSGTYTPSLTNTTNISASTAYACQYMRVGNVVTVSGKVDVTATATGNFVLGLSLPVASALTTAQQLGGTFSSTLSTETNAGVVYSDQTNDRSTFQRNAQTTGSVSYHFTFTYQVL